MQPRTAERFAHRFRIEYCGIGVPIEGHGAVIDLSKSGCRMETDTVPAKGAELKLQLFLADYSWPMKVDRAVVRWVKNALWAWSSSRCNLLNEIDWFASS